MMFTLQALQLSCILASLLLGLEAILPVWRWFRGKPFASGKICQLDLAVAGIALALVPVLAFWPRVFRDSGLLNPYLQPVTFNLSGLSLFTVTFWLKQHLRAAAGFPGWKEQRRVAAAVLAVAFGATAVEWSKAAIIQAVTGAMG